MVASVQPVEWQVDDEKDLPETPTGCMAEQHGQTRRPDRHNDLFKAQISLPNSSLRAFLKPVSMTGALMAQTLALNRLMTTIPAMINPMPTIAGASSRCPKANQPIIAMKQMPSPDQMA